MEKVKRVLISIIMAAFMCTFSGCIGGSVDNLYKLPQLSDDYVQLQKSLDEVLDTGAKYSAPTSGMYRQAVQLMDIDGDGAEEALGFFNVYGDDEPLKIYVFKDVGDEGYTVEAVIEGTGTGIDSVDYSDFNGDGIKELIIGWKIDGSNQMLTVYNMKDYQAARVIMTDYTEYVIEDLDGDNISELAVVRMASGDIRGEVEAYTMAADGEVVSSTAYLSSGAESISKLRTGYLVEDINAVFIESTYGESGTITDVFALQNGVVKNISADNATGISQDTIRLNSVYCTDIKGDMIMDVPLVKVLPSQSDAAVYWSVEWYSYRLSGRKIYNITTYHNISDGWYLIMPEDWRDNISVRRIDAIPGERTIIFSARVGQTDVYKDFLAIYTLSGNNRQDLAAADGRFILKAEQNTIYAAKILDKGSFSGNDISVSVSKEMVENNFKIIYTEWQTGKVS